MILSLRDLIRSNLNIKELILFMFFNLSTPWKNNLNDWIFWPKIGSFSTEGEDTVRVRRVCGDEILQGVGFN